MTLKKRAILTCPILMRVSERFNYFLSTLIENNTAYTTGITPSVNTVENSKPPMIAIAIGCQNSPPPRYNGIKLKSSEKKSFLVLLTSVRLMLAKQKLAIKTVSITEITYQLGYSSPSTFARAFKKHTQLSPLEYRTQVSS